MGQSKSKSVEGASGPFVNLDQLRSRKSSKPKSSKKWRRKQQGYSLPCGLNEVGIDDAMPSVSNAKRRSSFHNEDIISSSVHLVSYNKNKEESKRHQQRSSHLKNLKDDVEQEYKVHDFEIQSIDFRDEEIKSVSENEESIEENCSSGSDPLPRNTLLISREENFTDIRRKDSISAPNEIQPILAGGRTSISFIDSLKSTTEVLKSTIGSTPNTLDESCLVKVKPVTQSVTIPVRAKKSEEIPFLEPSSSLTVRDPPPTSLLSGSSVEVQKINKNIERLIDNHKRDHKAYDIDRNEESFTSSSSSSLLSFKDVKTIDLLRKTSAIEFKLSKSVPNFDVLSNSKDFYTCSSYSSSSNNDSHEKLEGEVFPIDEDDVLVNFDDVIDEAFNDILNEGDTSSFKEEEDEVLLSSEDINKRLPPVGCSSDETGGEECYDSLDEDGRRDKKDQEPQRNLPPQRTKSQSKPRRSLPALPKEASNYSSVTERALQILKQQTPSTLNEDIDLRKNLDSLLSSIKDSLEDVRDEENEPYKHFSPESYHADSGCQSLESNNNLTSMACHTPVENPSFLWVGLDATKEMSPSKKILRSKSTSSSGKKIIYRHSAPPGSFLDYRHRRELSPDKKSHASKSSRNCGHVRPLTRSSSRIHSAVVSGINSDTKSVTVEWHERGETKGKEIELETLLSLNQDLIPTSQSNGGVIPNKLPKYVQRSTNYNRNSSSATSQSTTGVTSGMRNRNRAASRQTMGISLPDDAVSSPSIPAPNNNGGNSINGHGSENVPPSSSSRSQPQQQQSQQQTSTNNLNNINSNNNNGAEAVGKAAGGVNRRRSNVVKEVERLKKNREERRAKQAEILEEKEAQKNIDPGNPNWEFLSMIRDYQEQLDFNPLQDGDNYTDHQITVCVRKRPLNKKEDKRKEVDVVTMPNKDQIIVHEPKTKVDLTKFLDNQHFRFDYAFDDTATNELVYKYTARPLVQNIFEGGMATCFAYGQTGSGKTHTMGGEFHGKSQDSKNGIYALATTDVFKYLKSPKYKTLKLTVSCSYFEIYSGKVFDLLSGKSKLRVLEDGKQQVVIVGLTEKVVECVEDVLKLITHGNNLRTSGQTSANAHSSRSHAVFQIILRQGKNKLFGKFSLIDLAGNERGADTHSADRQTRMEGAEINKSLLALKECIRALGRKGGHLPFRASKLTQVLRDSFIGEKSKTCMIAMVSPVLSSCEHTLNTLRYADRVKELGANDPATCQPPKSSSPMEQIPDMRMEDGVLSPEDSDLAQLRSMNEGELSADWYNFQEAVTHLQALEEELVERHRSTIDQMTSWIQEDAALIDITNEVDYDQDAYCQQLEEMINDKIEVLSALKERARNFRECQIDEEAMSRKLFTHKN